MNSPIVSRPAFPADYFVEAPTRYVAWEAAEARLRDAKNYWLCTVRPNGRPHSVPVWGVWWDGKLFYDGSEKTRHARNTAQNAHISVHLEDGDAALMLEGVVEKIERPVVDLTAPIAAEYRRKYAALGYAPSDDAWSESYFYCVHPTQIITWTMFAEDPTKFLFEEPTG